MVSWRRPTWVLPLPPRLRPSSLTTLTPPSSRGEPPACWCACCAAALPYHFAPGAPREARHDPAPGACPPASLLCCSALAALLALPAPPHHNRTSRPSGTSQPQPHLSNLQPSTTPHCSVVRRAVTLAAPWPPPQLPTPPTRWQRWPPITRPRMPGSWWRARCTT